MYMSVVCAGFIVIAQIFRKFDSDLDLTTQESSSSKKHKILIKNDNRKVTLGRLDPTMVNGGVPVNGLFRRKSQLEGLTPNGICVEVT